MGFAGNANDYYDLRNSFLNQVIERRLGIPITLSLLYIELGKRLGLGLCGIGLPGHFIVGCAEHDITEVVDFYIDPFNQGTLLDEGDCVNMVHTLYDGRLPFQMGYLRPVSSRNIIIRMINNLKIVYSKAKLFGKLFILQEMMILLEPANSQLLFERAEIKIEIGDYHGTIRDLEKYKSIREDSANDEQVETMLRTCRTSLSSLN